MEKSPLEGNSIATADTGTRLRSFIHALIYEHSGKDFVIQDAKYHDYVSFVKSSIC
jgi:hypothetical protein